MPLIASSNISWTTGAVTGSGTNICLSSSLFWYPKGANAAMYFPCLANTALAALTFFDASLQYNAFTRFFSATLIPPVEPKLLAES